MPKKKGVNRAKKLAKAAATVETITSEVIAAAYSASTPPIIPVFIKVCRLCESKDGPFLNIFDADKVTAKKIDDLMPFSITENDDLPHKICFRCSAKLEELYEFIQKCIRTQENLRSAIGNSTPFLTKSKMGKKLWEEKLNKSNMSNDDICDALIKKAMEGIKGIPLQPSVVNEQPVPETKQAKESIPPAKRVTRSKEPAIVKKDIKTDAKPDDIEETSLNQAKLSLEKHDTKSPINKITRSSKQNIEETEILKESPDKIPETVEPKKARGKPKKSDTIQLRKQEMPVSNVQNEKVASEKNSKATLNNLNFDYNPPSAPVSVKESESEEEKKVEPEKPFNIMDHISMIKVNGVGILFQCKLCNRNFLKKDVVESHSCAKNGVAKVDVPKSIPVPEPPKMPSVKYIKIDSDMKKSLTEKVKLAEKFESQRNLNLESNKEQDKILTPEIKRKPKIGPASKTKRNVIDIESSSSDTSTETPYTTPPVVPPVTNPPSIPPLPAVHFPNMPNLNGRFKLVPGPNNIFSLVEDVSSPTAVNSQCIIPPPVQETKKSGKKRKTAEIVDESEQKPQQPEVLPKKSKSPEIIDLEAKPYPVGLFQTVGHSQAPAPTFTTPAMKKQSYTIVQTGNPSKLLISTKAQPVDVEPPKKRPRKAKLDAREDSGVKEPFTVTLEDAAHPKDTGFFTFINVDPLLQPSYVLPTDNIIQESQISTSSAVTRQPAESKESKDKGKYSCNMCGEVFSREKKLLAHIQSHYSKMDEEDQERVEKTTKRRGRK